ncbi:hypothetical protein KR026_005832 [Drosophila bipectinata]|nr:hypothetical protein KR026_005832 [Drosophila bipectinata]
MAESQAEEVSPGAPAPEGAPAAADAAPASFTAPSGASEEAPLEEVVGELVEAGVEALGEDGENVPEEGQEAGQSRATAQVLQKDERKRQKLERIKKRLEQEEEKKKAELALEEAMKPKPVRKEEDKSSEKGSFILESEGGEDLGEDDLAEMRGIINQYDDLEVPESPEDTQEENAESDSDITPLPRLGTSLKGEFIRTFDSLPSLSDISLDITPEPTEPEPPKKQSYRDSDHGNFVESGQEDGAEEGGSGESEGSQAGAGGAVAAVTGSEEESSTEDDDFFDDIPEEPQVPDKRGEEEMDTMAMFIDIVEIEVEDKAEAQVKVEDPFWYRLTADFLHHLINMVVAKVESLDNIAKLLDKHKLVIALQQEVDEFMFERTTNSSLNNVVCDYYRRQGKFQNFATLSPDDSFNESIRYMNALNLVDFLMERLKTVKNNHLNESHKAMLELNSLNVLSYNEELGLDNFMRKTLVRRDMERLRRALEYDIKKMLDMRNQISQKRYELNLNLHTLAFVDEKVTRFERVTDTLTISQLLCANEAIIQLSKLLEEKSKDVAVMQSNYKKSMIEETCIREKRDMISCSLTKAKKEYNDCIERRNDLRKMLTDLQAVHANLKLQRAQLETKGGLLFKTALMYDYDNCMADVESKRKRIAGYKKTISDLTKRIYVIEKGFEQSLQ